MQKDTVLCTTIQHNKKGKTWKYVSNKTFHILYTSLIKAILNKHNHILLLLFRIISYQQCKTNKSRFIVSKIYFIILTYTILQVLHSPIYKSDTAYIWLILQTIMTIKSIQLLLLKKKKQITKKKNKRKNNLLHS